MTSVSFDRWSTCEENREKIVKISNLFMTQDIIFDIVTSLFVGDERRREVCLSVPNWPSIIPSRLPGSLNTQMLQQRRHTDPLYLFEKHQQREQIKCSRITLGTLFLPLQTKITLYQQLTHLFLESSDILRLPSRQYCESIYNRSLINNWPL